MNWARGRSRVDTVGERKNGLARGKVKIGLSKDVGKFFSGLIEGGNCSLNNFGEG